MRSIESDITSNLKVGQSVVVSLLALMHLYPSKIALLCISDLHFRLMCMIMTNLHGNVNSMIKHLVVLEPWTTIQDGRFPIA